MPDDPKAPAPPAAAGPAADSPAGPSPQETALRQAWAARELIIPGCLSLILDTRTVGAAGAKVFLNSFLRDAGSPTDPIEIILLEQLALAHFRLGQLHVRADAASDPDRLKILNAAAVRLLGELRRLALAIRQYRLPHAARSFSVIHQQNITSGGDQQVAYMDKSTPAQPEVSFSSDSKLSGSGDQSRDDDNEHGEKPEARSRWAAQRMHAAAVDE
jgi:hypothetical protein